MSKRLLIETRMSSLSLCESADRPVRPGYLGTLEGPCADYDNPTRNNNFYNRQCWVNAFNDPLVKESIEDKVFIGELDHPGDRLETKATNAAIVMTGYSFDDANKVVNGTFDILDTPNGKILKSLLDYGCKIGVSSRGEGDIDENDAARTGTNSILEDSFVLYGFDAVVLPAVKQAKPTLRESVQKRQTLRESLSQQVSDASSIVELNLIKKVIEATKLPEVDSLMESINIKSKELEGTTSSSENILADLEESTKRVNALTEENKELKEELATSKSHVSSLKESRQKLLCSVSRQKTAYEREKKTSVFRATSLKNKLDSLSESISSRDEKIRELQENLRATSSLSKKYTSKIKSLEESLSKSQAFVHQKINEVSQLNESISKVKKDCDMRVESMSVSLKKAQVSLKESKKALHESQIRNIGSVTAYAEKCAGNLGVDPQVLKSRITESTTNSDIDNMLSEEVDRSDRYRTFPIAHDPLIEKASLAKASTPKNNTSDEGSMSFLEDVMKRT